MSSRAVDFGIPARLFRIQRILPRMKTRFIPRCVICCLAVVGTFLLVGQAAFGQVRPAAAKEIRPPANTLRVQNASPALDKILKNWEIASSRTKSLEGEHFRYVYDLVFNVEKRAKGVFYYEAPDKGRIDLVGIKVAPGAVSEKKDPKTNVPYKVESDRPEKWICDGRFIIQVNELDKTVERFPIPPDMQGANIINGPLPFLFGMPAEKAKQRFHLTLLKETDSRAWLRAKPKWKQDAVNYRQATIILDKKTYLPMAVQLIDPPGNKETVFTFPKLVPNKKPNFLNIFRGDFLRGDPFAPKLRGYKVVTKSATSRPPQAKPNGPMVPSVIGFQWKEARKLLKQAGCTVKFSRGKAANRPELVYVVYQQNPLPSTPLVKGQSVVLTLYDKGVQQTSKTDR